MKARHISEPRSHALPKSPASAEEPLEVSHTPQRQPDPRAAGGVPPTADQPPAATDQNRYRPGDSDDQPRARRAPDDGGEDPARDTTGGHSPIQETGRKPVTPRSVKKQRRQARTGDSTR
jgi:hypothetical protein